MGLVQIAPERDSAVFAGKRGVRGTAGEHDRERDCDERRKDSEALHGLPPLAGTRWCPGEPMRLCTAGQPSASGRNESERANHRADLLAAAGASGKSAMRGVSASPPRYNTSLSTCAIRCSTPA